MAFFSVENPIFFLVDGGETCSLTFGFCELSCCSTLWMLNIFKCVGGEIELVSGCFANISMF